MKKELDENAKQIGQMEIIKSELREEMTERKRAEDKISILEEDNRTMYQQSIYYKKLLEENKIALFPSMTDSMGNKLDLSFKDNSQY